MDQVRLVIHVSTQFENCVELADEENRHRIALEIRL